jgi:hypothetical protein
MALMEQIELKISALQDVSALRDILRSHVRLRYTEKASGWLVWRTVAFTITGDEEYLCRFLADYREWSKAEREGEAW